MILETRYHRFRIAVRPSPETNDHEVRFFGDEEDIIARFWNDMIGLDPDDVLFEPSPLTASDQARKVTVARCSCGVIGCGSIEVNIEQSANEIKWFWDAPGKPVVVRFDAIDYEDALAQALSDKSWETPDRTAGRLVGEKVDRGALARLGFVFNWASGRIRQGALTASLWLEPGPYQILVHHPWNDETADDIANSLAKMLRESPPEWLDVEWFPQQPMLCAPLVLGPHCRRGGT